MPLPKLGREHDQNLSAACALKKWQAMNALYASIGRMDIGKSAYDTVQTCRNDLNFHVFKQASPSGLPPGLGG